MPSRRLLGVALSVPLAVAAAISVGVGPAGATHLPATVVASTPLPLVSYGWAAAYADLVVDADHGHVFVSGGRGTTEIMVADLDGQLVGSVPSQQGAAGLALSADGNTLYAALTDSDSITAIDTATLTERGRHDLGAGTCPSDLAVAGRGVWFSYGCGQDGGRIGSLELPPGGSPVVSLDQGGTWYNPPLLESAPAGGAVLVALEYRAAPPTVTSFDVSGGTAAVRASTRLDAGAGQDLALTPDGTRVAVSTYNSWDTPVLSTADLSPVYAYDTPYLGESVAFAASGQFAGGAADLAVNAYAIGENRKVWTFAENLGDSDLSVHALAWAPDGRRLYAVSSSSYNDRTPVLHVLAAPPVETFLSADLLTWPVRVRKPLTIEGRLTTEDNSLTGTRALQVTRQDRRGLVRLPDVTTGADGSYRLIDVPRTDGDTVYTIRFAGTEILLPTQYTYQFTVTRR
jgi:DNA-binding beta-propeller fold protein YncE